MRARAAVRSRFAVSLASLRSKKAQKFSRLRRGPPAAPAAGPSHLQKTISRPRTASGPAARDKTFKKSQNPPWLALTVAGAPPRRGAMAGGKKKQTTEVQYAAGQKWGLDPDIDHDTRVVCEGT